MCKNVKSLAEELHTVRECQRHQSQVLEMGGGGVSKEINFCGMHDHSDSFCSRMWVTGSHIHVCTVCQKMWGGSNNDIL